MDELINQVAQRSGVAPDQARVAVETVLGPIASQLDGALAAGATGGLADAAKGLGGMLGNR